MREIKFRALDDKGKFQIGTYYHGVLYPTSFRGHYVNDTQIDEKTLGQYTGLKDNKGRGTEIYEGDVFDFSGVKYFVKWSEDGCNFVLTTGRGYDTRNCFDLTCDSIFFNEVIGNIHENPELLCTSQST